MKSIISLVTMFSWFIFMCLVQCGTVHSFRTSCLSFIGRGNCLNIPSSRVQRMSPLFIRKEKIKIFPPDPNPFTEEEGGGDIVKSTVNKLEHTLEWTPETDAKLLKELKRLKRLRWYKVAKLMGEGATATGCHDRWVKLTWKEETRMERLIRQKEDEKLNAWTEYEVACLSTSVARNVLPDDTIDWERVGREMGLEGFVCERKHNSMLEEAQAAQDAQNEALSTGLAESEIFWSSHDENGEENSSEDEVEEEEFVMRGRKGDGNDF